MPDGSFSNQWFSTGRQEHCPGGNRLSAGWDVLLHRTSHAGARAYVAGTLNREAETSKEVQK